MDKTTETQVEYPLEKTIKIEYNRQKCMKNVRNSQMMKKDDICGMEDSNVRFKVCQRKS